MKYLVTILMLAAAPAQAADIETCDALSKWVESMANARDAGLSMEASKQMVRQSIDNPELSETLQKTVQLVYTAGASRSPGELAMSMFNACMEN